MLPAAAAAGPPASPPAGPDEAAGTNTTAERQR
jgi:hypothetical protein